jgi:predicted Zn-ribbon and HTH transcriptional regulator
MLAEIEAILAESSSQALVVNDILALINTQKRLDTNEDTILTLIVEVISCPASGTFMVNPVTLDQCGHTFDNSGRGSQMTTCPLCRHEIILTALTLNQTIAQINQVFKNFVSDPNLDWERLFKFIRLKRQFVDLRDHADNSILYRDSKWIFYGAAVPFWDY